MNPFEMNPEKSQQSITAYFEICSRVDGFCNNNNSKWERASYSSGPTLTLFIATWRSV